MSIDQRLIFVTHCVYPLPWQFIQQIDQRKTSTTLLRLKGKNDALDNSLSTNPKTDRGRHQRVLLALLTVTVTLLAAICEPSISGFAVGLLMIIELAVKLEYVEKEKGR